MTITINGFCRFDPPFPAGSLGGFPWFLFPNTIKAITSKLSGIPKSALAISWSNLCMPWVTNPLADASKSRFP